MSGHGYNVKKPAVKRHRRILRDNIQGVTNNALQRLSRKAGVVRASGVTYIMVRDDLKEYLTELIEDSCVVTEYGGRKTIKADDVKYALERRETPYFG